MTLCMGDEMEPGDMDNLIFGYLLYSREKRKTISKISRDLDGRRPPIRYSLRRLARMGLVRRNSEGWFVYGKRKILKGFDPPAFRQGK